MTEIGKLSKIIMDTDASWSIITTIGEKLRGKTKAEKERMALALAEEVKRMVAEEKKSNSR